MQNPPNSQGTLVDPLLLSAQYSSMRAEMIKRLEIRSQLVALTLLVAGTFLSVGLQPNVPESALLVYPPLAMFLAASWKQNDMRTGQMVRFIRDNIEKHIGPSPAELGWENYRASLFPPSRLTPFAVSGVFVVTQLLAMALAGVRFSPLIISLIQTGHLDHDIAELVVDGALIVIGLLSTIATFVFIRRRQRF